MRIKANTIKYFLRNSNLFPILYANMCSNLMTYEHVVPKCYIHSNVGRKDYHNIYATPACMNLKRSNYMFSDFGFKEKTEIDVNRRLISPRECDRGVIARSVLYMISRYDINYNVNTTMMEEWNMLYKPSFKEICHNEFVNNIQGNKNPFIS